MDNLRAAGATVDPVGTVSADFLAPEKQLLTVNGEGIQPFEFASSEEADAAAGGVSANGLLIVTTMADGTQMASMVDWVFAPPHYYKAGKLIVLYAGSDGDVNNALQEAMGPQFAGGESLLPAPGVQPVPASRDMIAPNLRLTFDGAEYTEPVPTATVAPTPTPAITVIQFGTPDSDFSSDVAIDGAGNVYVVGTKHQGALPGQTSLGDADAYLRKYDGHGNELWTRRFGTQSEDHGIGVTVDRAGNLYVVGITRGAFPGNTGLVGIDYDAYVRKFDGDGNELWTRQFGTPRTSGAQGEDFTSDVAVDGAGNIYAVGSSFGSLLGQSRNTLGYDAYLRKFDSDGNDLWTRQFGTQVSAEAKGVMIDGTGNVYVVGSTSGALPGQTSMGEGDAFIRKYDADGNELWTRQAGTQSWDSTNGVVVDGAGSVYAVGSASGALPGQTHLGNSDAYVRKYDGDGNELWTRQFGRRGLDMAEDVVVDGAGNVYVLGTTRLSLPGQSNMEPVLGGSDVFIRKYDTTGNEIWTNQFSTQKGDVVAGMVLDGAGSLYVVGSTEGAFAGQTSSGSYDAFVLKMPDAPLLMPSTGAAADLSPDVTPAAKLTPVQRLASRLSVMTLVVALAEDGYGPLDNFLPCVRRGVINYYNTDAGRNATFSSCDLGDGIIVQGSGELKTVLLKRSREATMDTITISRIIWEGQLTPVIDGETEIQIDQFAIASVGVQLNHGEGRVFDRLQLDSMTVMLLGETMKVDDETLISQLFDTSAMDINSIPNTSKSLSALTESDMKRLAYDQALFLGRFLINEVMESQRGNHSHEYPCGTSVVSQNLEDQTKRIDNTWNDCDLISSGISMDGAFSLEGNFDRELLAITTEGVLTIGGGIPKITIRRLEWSFEWENSLPAPVRISGKIYGEVDERSFSFDLIVDD